MSFLLSTAVVSVTCCSFGVKSRSKSSASIVLGTASTNGESMTISVFLKGISSIGLAYIFPVNSEILKEKGFSDNDIRTFRFYLSTYVNALAEQNRARAGESVSVGSAAYFSDVDGIGFTITFDNLDAQKEFFGTEDDEEEKESGTDTKSSGFFIRKVQMSTSFPVSNTQSADNLKQVCKLAITSWANFNKLDLKNLLTIYDDSNFIYHFSSAQSSLKSDLCYDDANLHHNVFIKSADDISAGDTSITYFTSYPNTPVWYITALLLTLAGMTIVYFMMNKKKEKRINK